MVGKVEAYNAKKGYGFISSQNESYFFMRGDVLKTHQHCRKEEVVSFDPIQDHIGTRAINVKRI